MTIQQLLREKNLSRYQLSKLSGVPWATLADIYSGKTLLTRCSARTLSKLSSALDIPMEQLITITAEKRVAEGGKPQSRSYLEKDYLGNALLLSQGAQPLWTREDVKEL